MRKRLWDVSHEAQRIVFQGAVPEIDIEDAFGIVARRTRRHAVADVSLLLTELGARADIEANVRPIERCALCLEDFETIVRHSCLSLLHVEFEEFALTAQTLDASYPACFCPRCSPGVRRTLYAWFEGALPLAVGDEFPYDK